jgi:WD repeat-containing protein 35
MDDITADPEHPDKECIVNFETKSLRDTRELISSVPISEAFQFIEDNPHIRLWRILAESALEQLNFVVADKAFVRCSDYQGIQFVKRLKVLTDRKQQRAEVAVYFRRFDEAENIYLQEMDSKDLAVELRTRLGDWFRVVHLIQNGAGDDSLLNKAYNNIGDYYADRQKWLKASKYYAKANNLREMVNCSYILDDYVEMEKLIDQIPAGSDFLKDVGEKFMSVGLCFEAVESFLKAGDPKAAIDCCVLLNQWDQAVELAEKHKFQQIQGLLTKYATHLLAEKKLFQAVDLYRKANKFTDAAKLLATMGHEAGQTKVFPLRAKKLYVLSAMEVDRFKHRMLDSQMTYGSGSTQQTLQSLMDHDAATSGATSKADGLSDPWHGAEAYHFYLLAQRQLYSGAVDAAMKTALRLMDYEDVLEPKDVHSLIALTSFYNKFFGVASNALIRLECLEDTTPEERKKYAKVALQMFLNHKPEDPATRKFPCPNKTCDGQVKDFSIGCDECGKSIPACVASGRAIISVSGSGASDIYICRTCKHRMYDREQKKFANCPLCHSLLK